MIKSGRIRWWGHRGFYWRNLRERDHLEDLDVDRRIILKCIFQDMG
jgi:hypothetical protein